MNQESPMKSLYITYSYPVDWEEKNKRSMCTLWIQYTQDTEKQIYLITITAIVTMCVSLFLSWSHAVVMSNYCYIRVFCFMYILSKVSLIGYYIGKTLFCMHCRDHWGARGVVKINMCEQSMNHISLKEDSLDVMQVFWCSKLAVTQFKVSSQLCIQQSKQH